MADPRTRVQTLVDRLIGHLAAVLTAATGQPVRALAGVGHTDVDWQVPVEVSGTMSASVVLGLSEDAARRLAVAILGTQAPVDAATGNALHALVSQAADALAAEESGMPLRVVIGPPRHGGAEPGRDASHHELVMTGDEPPRIVVWIDALGADAPGVTGMSPAPAALPAIVAPTVQAEPEGKPRNLEVVLDIELPITVRFGETRLTLDALSRLGPGAMIDLERSPDDPVDLLINGRLIARGDVVVVSGCYGVRVSEVVSAADRLRSLEG
jgi:flagellar motor switch protein FliN